ncbi:hypothetical protein [Afipia broomeae]|uniref:Uncharacterized protein n=1 Tax=Afipia broomeae ATCC 49717 TaxID=883078 RepID=K8PL13_9BRAD|nr:hypothetical protein [Afipia broomeae]EKS41459.1 hypothetical protein HMPREF9695_00551 [Afipia broomeae ATCC 49717]
MQITSPEWVWAILIALVGAALAFGIMRNRQRTAREVRMTEDVTESLYKKGDRKERDARRR